MLRTIGTVCVVAGVAMGCNHDNVRAEQREEQNALAQEQSEEQRTLAEQKSELHQEQTELQREQQQERAELRQDQVEERREERLEARGDMIEQTNELGEDRDDLREDVRDLNALVVQACAAVAEPERKACPLSSERVLSVSNMTDGVRIKLDAFAGPKATVEERIGCYRARIEIQNAMARVAAKKTTTLATDDCVLNQPELDMEVTENDGQVALELTTDGAASIRALRNNARALVQDNTHASAM